MRLLCRIILIACGWALTGPSPAGDPSLRLQAVELAGGGRARLPVVIAPNASPQTADAAKQLADLLGRMAGARFEVTTGDGISGVALGRLSEFPALSLKAPWDADDPTRREDYLLRSHAKGLYLMGATDLAARHAAWDLLYRLGYRQYFPGERWEIVPGVPELRIEADVHEHPAYLSRRLWYGFGAWDCNQKAYADWCARNRIAAGIDLRTGHAYDGILGANKADFAAHPEYLGLVEGVRKSTKFCASNPGLRALVVGHALRQFRDKPDLDSVSMDPSDGGGWCECGDCAKMGGITDRALALANAVAEAVDARHPGKYVGLYAYNYHSPPPSIRAHPRVVVSVATAFIKGGFTLEDLLAGWSAKASTLGIREYYSVNTWDRDLPAAARGGNLDYLKRTIPEFHSRGARHLSAESSDNWGPNGLGYWLASRMLWDVREAGRLDAHREEFLALAFGPAKEPMREFYRQLDGSKPHLVVGDQVGRMFRSLDQARRLADTPPVRARLDDLLLYARYVDLYQRYAQARGDARQQAFEALIRHAYRMRPTMMVHTLALYRDLAGRDKSVTLPAEAKWNAAEGKNPWKSSRPFDGEELASFLAEGIERYPLAKIDFAPVAFSDDLVEAGKLNLPEVPAGQIGSARGRQALYTRVSAVPASLDLKITGGLIAGYRDRGNVRVEVWKLGGASRTGEKETLAARDQSVPPDGREHAVAIPVKEPGLYRVTFDDGGDRTLIRWEAKLPCVIKSTLDEPMNKNYTDLWQLYFYVPRGTKVIGLFGGEHGEVRDSAGRPVFWLNGREPNYYGVAVPDGEDGRLWSLRYARGSIRLLTVPPFLARSAAEILLPVEVVQKDAVR